jgi:hypothetical protein
MRESGTPASLFGGSSSSDADRCAESQRSAPLLHSETRSRLNLFIRSGETRSVAFLARRPVISVTLCALLLAVMLVLTWLSIDLLSAVRAYVAGEGLWSKAQKDAAYELVRYGATGDPRHWEAYTAPRLPSPSPIAWRASSWSSRRTTQRLCGEDSSRAAIILKTSRGCRICSAGSVG